MLNGNYHAVISGANGFVGSNLVPFLSRFGVRLTCLVRDENSCNYGMFPWVDTLSYDKFWCLEQDRLFQKSDLVVFVNLVGTQRCLIQSDLIESNYNLPSKFLKFFEFLPHRCIFINFGTSISKGASHYAKLKHDFVSILECVSRILPSDKKIFNFITCNVYGPGDRSNRIIPFLIRSCISDVTHVDLTEGGQKKDFIFIDDVLTAVLSVIQNFDRVSRFDQSLLGSGSCITIREVAELIKSKILCSTRLNFGALGYNNEQFEIEESALRPLADLGWRTSISLNDGLERSIRSYGYREIKGVSTL